MRNLLKFAGVLCVAYIAGCVVGTVAVYVWSNSNA